MRLLVIGTHGQLSRAVAERSRATGVAARFVSRPMLDLAEPDRIAGALGAIAADVVVNAAAYTKVDQAEYEPDLAQRINGESPGRLAALAAAAGCPFIHISTDYVFDGTLDRPYLENDPVAPLGAYGRSKLAGEAAVASATANHAILRTAWVYAPFGANFVRTMLRLATSHPTVQVVDDQIGSPTSALDLADAVLQVAHNLHTRPVEASLRGIFHTAGSGFATWAEVASTVFARARALGGPAAEVVPITTAEYPTPARRPANSRLDCARLASRHGVTLPDWRASVDACVTRLLTSS